ncbi:MAG: hypothetical protein M3N48_13540, partial [Verrucomicrobiota bacterium]|nr:hypothetical protein [Verrucomicrobiota bacterium]
MKNGFRISLVTTCIVAGLATVALANTYTVTNTNDSGAGSLRQAINDANAHPNSPANTPDTIAFAIPGSGVQTIAVLSQLPTVTDPVIIDGYTQSPCASNSAPCSHPNTLADGDDAVLLIELSGSSAPGNPTGLLITAGNSTVRGLVVNGFRNNGDQGGFGIWLDTNGSNIVAGNFIGTDPTGLSARGNGNDGVFVFNSSKSNTIGGTTPAARNVISGNGRLGILITDPGVNNNVVQGNFIGTDKTGTKIMRNTFVGVLIQAGAQGNLIGGPTPSARNVISGNGNGGIAINNAGTTGNTVQGNFIGTDVSGAASLSNINEGISIDQASNNTIGLNADGTGLRNIIAYNDGSGVLVSDGTNPAIGNAIRGNSLFSNSGPGIRLSGNANNQQNFPVIVSASYAGGNVSIAGSLNSKANTKFHLEFFGNQAPDPGSFYEGRRFLGSTEVTTDASGYVSFNVTLPYVTGSPKLTSTATDPAGNTSEFSPGFSVRGAPDQTVLARGVFLRSGGTLSTVALSGQTVPGSGAMTQRFDGPAFNNKSTVAFVNTGIGSGGAIGAVFLKKIGAPLTVIAKTGDPAPVPGGAVFATVGTPFDDLVLNNNDDLAFIGVYTQDGGATFKMGIFLKPDGQPMISVVLYGDALPGTGGGTLCATSFENDPIAPGKGPSSIDGPWMNDSQVVLFKTDAICGGTGNFGESAFAKRPAQAIEQAVLIGEAAPSSVGGTIQSV